MFRWDDCVEQWISTLEPQQTTEKKAALWFGSCTGCDDVSSVEEALHIEIPPCLVIPTFAPVGMLGTKAKPKVASDEEESISSNAFEPGLRRPPQVLSEERSEDELSLQDWEACSITAGNDIQENVSAPSQIPQHLSRVVRGHGLDSAPVILDGRAGLCNDAPKQAILAELRL